MHRLYTMNKAKTTAVSGMMGALSVVIMLLSSVLPILMYILPIATGMIVLFVSLLYNKKWGFGVYAVTSFLCLLLLTDKETALAYAMFFGYYPLVKDSFEKIPVVVAYPLKLILFNASAVGMGLAGVYIFGLSAEEYYEFGKATIPILLGLGNVVFVLYDFMITKYMFIAEDMSRKFKSIIK